MPERQLRTDAYPCSGDDPDEAERKDASSAHQCKRHADTAYHAAVPMGKIQVNIAGTYAKAKTLRLPSNLKLHSGGGRTVFEVPTLPDYEMAVLEQ